MNGISWRPAQGLRTIVISDLEEERRTRRQTCIMTRAARQEPSEQICEAEGAEVLKLKYLQLVQVFVLCRKRGCSLD